MINKSPCALFSVNENRVCFDRRLETKINLLKNCRGRKIFSKFCWKNRTFFYICIKLFRTQLKMAQQTKFVKLTSMQIKILSF